MSEAPGSGRLGCVAGLGRLACIACRGHLGGAGGGLVRERRRRRRRRRPGLDLRCIRIQRAHPNAHDASALCTPPGRRHLIHDEAGQAALGLLTLHLQAEVTQDALRLQEVAIQQVRHLDLRQEHHRSPRQALPLVVTPGGHDDLDERARRTGRARRRNLFEHTPQGVAGHTLDVQLHLALAHQLLSLGQFQSEQRGHDVAIRRWRRARGIR